MIPLYIKAPLTSETVAAIESSDNFSEDWEIEKNQVVGVHPGFRGRRCNRIDHVDSQGAAFLPEMRGFCCCLLIWKYINFVSMPAQLEIDSFRKSVKRAGRPRPFPSFCCCLLVRVKLHSTLNPGP